MYSSWTTWPDEMRHSWRTTDGAIAHVCFPLTSEPWVQYQDGTRAPKRFTYFEFPSDTTAPYFIVECDHQAVCDCDPNGAGCDHPDQPPRVVAVHVVARGTEREVRPQDLRTLRLSKAVDAAIEHAFKMPVRVQADDLTEPLDLEAQPPTDQQASAAKGLRHRSRRRITPELLREAASIYVADRRGAPTKAVREHFFVSAAQASTYVRMAKEAGFIPEGQPRKDSD
jgi:hypothetical protein